MLKKLLTAAFCASVCVLFSTAANAFAQAARSEAWLEDFEQLKREMAAHYANLDWAVAERRIDLKQLSEQTEARLRETRSDSQARQAIELFVRAFGDGHFHVQWASANRPVAPATNAPIKKDAAKNDKPSAPASLCDRLDFRERKLALGIAFDRLPGFEPHLTADSKYFPVGVLVLPNDERPSDKKPNGKRPNGKRIGLLRIAIFSEHWFPDLCETAASELGLHKDSACDEACGDRVELKAADLLTAALERQLAALKAASIDALLVDITGNGGGSDWVEPAARVLTRKPLRSPRIGFIKHEHWAKDFQSRLADIERDAAQATGPRRDMLKRAADTYRRALAAAKEPVARDAVWQNKPVPALVAKDPELFGGGILSYFQKVPQARISFIRADTAITREPMRGRSWCWSIKTPPPPPNYSRPCSRTTPRPSCWDRQPSAWASATRTEASPRSSSTAAPRSKCPTASASAPTAPTRRPASLHACWSRGTPTTAPTNAPHGS